MVLTACPLPKKFEQVIKRYVSCWGTALQPTGKQRQKDINQGKGTVDVACQDGLEDMLAQKEALKIGEGVHRVAFEYGVGDSNCILKVARTERGQRANLDEYMGYRGLPPRAKKLFVPIQHVDPQGRWVTVPWALTNETGLEEPADLIEEDLRKKIDKLGISCPDLQESNVGMYKGRPVVIDMGWGVSSVGASCKMGTTKTGRRTSRLPRGQSTLF